MSKIYKSSKSSGFPDTMKRLVKSADRTKAWIESALKLTPNNPESALEQLDELNDTIIQSMLLKDDLERKIERMIKIKS